MNKKIFTFLACVLVLLMAAFDANAKIIGGGIATGDTVRTLEDAKTIGDPGWNRGSFHIRIDSVFDGTKFIPAFGAIPSADQSFIENLMPRVNGASPTGAAAGKGRYTSGDTLVLGITEQGRVIPVNMTDMRYIDNEANYKDLLTTLWCIQIQQSAIYGQMPTFTFHNKCTGYDLDFVNAGDGTVSKVPTTYQNWMYSYSYTDGQLNFARPIYARPDDGTNNYRVLTWENASGNRYITQRVVPISTFLNNGVGTGAQPMIKVTIVEAAPCVLDTMAFNTTFGTKSSGQVKPVFDPTTISMNPFDNNLKAIAPVFGPGISSYYGSPFTTAQQVVQNKGYISLSINGNANNVIYNDSANYINDYATKYLKIENGTSGSITGTANRWRNGAYRFVYFPSRDSLVINALHVYHANHPMYNNSQYRDSLTPYKSDINNIHPIYYGLYNETIHDALIVRCQDLYEGGQRTIMSIGQHPSNVHITLNDLSCGYIPPTPAPGIYMSEGVYTIWDNKGRLLGVKIYNGSLWPQWIELEEGECPDRIPSYQWVIEKSTNANGLGQFNITNREFGNMKNDYGGSLITSITRFKNVFLPLEPGDRPATPLFSYATLLDGVTPTQLTANDSIALKLLEAADITIQYLRVQPQNDCKINDGKGQGGGFRPVNTVYTFDRHLGFKWFRTESATNDVNFGKSDNYVDYYYRMFTNTATATNFTLSDAFYRLGMDHNAFNFNYYHKYSDGYYLRQTSVYTDSILKADEAKYKAGFRFMVGTNLREGTYYQAENYGYPANNSTNYPSSINSLIGGTSFKQYRIVDSSGNYTVNKPLNSGSVNNASNYDLGKTYYQYVRPLQRYYYEMKIADFYSYRDGLAEQYVVLKGAKSDYSDVRNSLKYGLADVHAEREPFKFANVYLRETFFLDNTRALEPNENEERNMQDPTRRVYYAVMDRIEQTEFDVIRDLLGLEVSSILHDLDGSTSDSPSPYSLAIWSVDEFNGMVKAQGKIVSSVRVSTFALLNNNFELYRRLNSTRDDNAKASDSTSAGADGGQVDIALDAPKVLRIHRQLNKVEYLNEDALSGVSYNTKGINYLGSSNYFERPEIMSPARTVNYNLFIDTAYINRGTGYIKPQYLIAVGNQVIPQIINERKVVTQVGCCDQNTDIIKDTIPGYTYGRYLINATDSARKAGYTGMQQTPLGNNDYLANASWDRFVFVPAIHDYKNDRLYILSEVEKQVPDIAIYTYTDEATNELRYNMLKLDSLVRRGLNGGLVGRTFSNPDKYGAYYQFGDKGTIVGWQNYHNDVTFSLRFTVPEAKNARLNDGVDYVSNDTKKFFIESETTDRTPYGNNKIAPMQGGWIKLYNDIPCISRSSYEEAINLAEVFNIDNNLSFDGKATSNPDIKNGITVIGGVEEISILNASGKAVTVTNLLGQTVAKSVLKSDNATVKAPKGILVVQVEGEKVVKTVVK